MRPPHEVTLDWHLPALLEDPYPRYAAAQRATPVFRTPDGAVYLTRHADCATLLAEPRFRRRPSPDAAQPFAVRTPLDDMLGQWMLFMDPPRHEVVRAGFTALLSDIARLEPAIRRIVRGLAGDLRGEVDFVAAFASPLPALVICELLSLPSGDRPLFEQWSATLTRALESGTEEQMRAAVPASRAMRDYFARAPLPGLSAAETVFGLAFLVWAGHETTRNLLASGLLALVQHPGEMRRLRDEPRLLRPALEELLRYTSPVQKLSRWTQQTERFGDYQVAGGTMVTALVGAANRDPEAFADAQALELARAPNRHLAFGRGLHACLGAALARLEAQVAFSELLACFDLIEVTSHRWRPNSALRGLDTLELALRRA
jgi:cytochrome P450